jgi:hypothetical protein
VLYTIQRQKFSNGHSIRTIIKRIKSIDKDEKNLETKMGCLKKRYSLQLSMLQLKLLKKGLKMKIKK